MQARPKLGIAAGACSILLAGAAMFAADDSTNSITISLDKSTSVPPSDQTFPNHTQANTLNIESIGLDISFSAFPDAFSGNTLRFTFEDPDFTIYVPTEIQYSPDQMLNVSGTLSETGQGHLTLTNAIIIPLTETHPSAATSSATSEKTPPHTSSHGSVNSQEQKVFVSSSGKYHSSSECSGMKSYTEMSLTEALDAGCTACQKCN